MRGSRLRKPRARMRRQLSTLGHPDYKSTYDGDLPARDAAYHQGPVWAWLIASERRPTGVSSRERTV